MAAANTGLASADLAVVVLIVSGATLLVYIMKQGAVGAAGIVWRGVA